MARGWIEGPLARKKKCSGHTDTDARHTVIYRARYRDSQHKVHTKNFCTKKDAEDYLDVTQPKVKSGEWVDPNLGKVTIGEWHQKWLASRVKIKPTTRAGYSELYTNLVAPTFGTTRLTAVTHEDIQVWVVGLLDSGLSPSRVRQAHQVLSAMLGYAVKTGRLTRNPAVGIELARVTRAKEMRILTPEQLHVLADAAAPYTTAILTLGYCGLRWGELVALRVRSVDLLRRRLVISESATDVSGRLVFGTPKSHRVREVTGPRVMFNFLEGYISGAGRGPDDLVFKSEGGGPLRNSNFRSRVFAPALARAGLPPMTIHELRHSAASWLISIGATVLEVQNQLGHSSATITLNTYSHLFEGSLDTLATRMDAAAPSLPPRQSVVYINSRRNNA